MFFWIATLKDLIYPWKWQHLGYNSAPEKANHFFDNLPDPIPQKGMGVNFNCNFFQTNKTFKNNEKEKFGFRMRAFYF